jgi:hypothetical protein
VKKNVIIILKEMKTMKYSLPCRMRAEHLKKADEIKIEYNDIDIFKKLYEEYDAELVIILRTKEEVDNLIVDIHELDLNRITCEIYNLTLIDKLKQLDINYYLSYPISNFYDLKKVVELGVS